METQQGKTEKNPSQKRQKGFVFTQVLLRTLTFVATLVAALVMATDKQSVNLFGIQFDAHYTYSSAFRFFVGANTFACAYSVLAMPIFVVYISKSSKSSGCFFMFLLDMIVTVLVMAACSAATAIAEVARKGNSHTGWAPICDDFRRFCDHGTVSVGSSYAALVLFFLLCVSSAYQNNKPRPA